MPRFKLVVYREGLRVVVFHGWSPLLGFFLTVLRGGRKEIEYDILADEYDGLDGVLRGLVSTGVVCQDAVGRALELLPVVGDVQEIDDEDARVVATIIVRLKSAVGS